MIATASSNRPAVALDPPLVRPGDVRPRIRRSRPFPRLLAVHRVDDRRDRRVADLQHRRRRSRGSVPFIFLTLLLSLQASYAAPLILLAQNRQDDRDRVRIKEDRDRTERLIADTGVSGP